MQELKHTQGSASTRSEATGSTLVLALIAVTVVSILAMALFQLSLATTRRQSASIDKKLAFYLAEAGLAESYASLSQAKTGNVGTPERPAVYNNGLFWVETTEDPSGLVEIESTGMYGGGRVTLGLVAEPVEVNLMSLGIFVSDSLSVNPDTLIDSFDSGLGSYVSQVGSATNTRAILGSNGDITLSSAVSVLGDATAGVSGTINLHTGAAVSGTISQRPAPQNLPEIDVPDHPSQPGFVHSSAIPRVLAPGESAFDSIRVETGSALIVRGPGTLVVGDLYLERDGELTFDTSGGPIEMYVTGDVDLKPDSLVYTPEDKASDVLVQVSSPDSKSVSFGSTSQFYGFFYAPHATLKLGAKFEVFGGLIGKGMNMAAQGRMHYDLEGLGSRADLLPKLHAWRVVDIPQDVAQRRIDPFVTLGLQRSLLPKPADAHQDQWLILDYLDLDGVAQTYEDWESGFDWTQVSVVTLGIRDGVRFDQPFADQEPAPADPDGPPPGTITDWISDPSHSSADLLQWLLEVAPLAKGEINEAIKRSPPMDAADLMTLLEAHSPLAAGNLTQAYDPVKSPLSNAQMLAISLANTPLATGDLNAAIDVAPFTSAELTQILIENSPVKTGIRNNVDGRVPALDPDDYATFQAAQ